MLARTGGEICIFVKEIRAPLPLVGVWGNWCTVSPRRGAVGEGIGDKRQPHNLWGGGRCVYLLKKSGHPPPKVGVWENRCKVTSGRGTGRGRGGGRSG